MCLRDLLGRASLLSAVSIVSRKVAGRIGTQGWSVASSKVVRVVLVVGAWSPLSGLCALVAQHGGTGRRALQRQDTLPATMYAGERIAQVGQIRVKMSIKVACHPGY